MDRKVADTGGKYRCKGAVSKLRSNPGEVLRASAASSPVKDKDKKKCLTRALIPELTLHTRLDSGWPPRHSFPWPERRAIPAAKR